MSCPAVVKVSVFEGPAAVKTSVPGGLPPVQSVNGKTGNVELTPADIGAATAAQGAMADTAIQPGNAALTDAREWSAETISQAEAEAGSATTRRAFTAQRVFQAVAAWWAGSASKTKLDGISNGATANSSDAQLRDRSTHTGTQPASTITGLSTVATSGAYGDLTGTPDLSQKADLVNGAVPSAQLPGFVDDVLEFADFAAFPATGEAGKLYISLATNRQYRWSGSVYVEINPSPGSTDAVPEGSVNLYFTSARASAAAPVQSVAGRTGTVTLTKSDVGLSNVDNTSDANKPISTATAAALAEITTLPGSLTADANGNLTFTAKWIQSTNGAASAPAHALTGTWFTGGTSTTTKPQFLIEPVGTTSTSWNTAGTGLGVNAATGFTGDLAWFGVNGSPALTLSRVGTGALIRNTSQNNDASITIEQTRLETFGRTWINLLGGAGAPGDGIVFGVLNKQALRIYGNSGIERISIASTFGVNWNEDLWLWRDAAGTLAQRNSTQAQIYRIYNTYTSATNFERLNIRWSANQAIIDTEAGSGGGTLRGLKIGSTATSLLGFYNATPVVQPTAVADATDATSVITQLNLALARLRSLGLIAT